MRMQNPASAIEDAIRAANRGDVSAMVDHFAEDAVLTLSPVLPGMPDIFRGRAEIRGYVQQIVSSGFHAEPGEIKWSGSEVAWRSTVSGGLLRQAGIAQAEVSSRAIVQGGLIRSIDIHYDTQVVHRLEEALLEHA